ncbi:hypothetical protein A7Q10_08345 [Methylacidiphilum caldifontis]|uniref:Uncharacterized protein n=1 Tax=Methylacidiphilum caldifontis TaxID=2795386 RepID=A0A4Y8PBN4_9BACT|nr:hypothetical protein A7Q10_08345 [Methylacidiphilum caldifontis]
MIIGEPLNQPFTHKSGNFGSSLQIKRDYLYQKVEKEVLMNNSSRRIHALLLALALVFWKRKRRA